MTEVTDRDELVEWIASWGPPGATAIHLAVLAGNTSLLSALLISLAVTLTVAIAFVWWRVATEGLESRARGRVVLSTIASVVLAPVAFIGFVGLFMAK